MRNEIANGKVDQMIMEKWVEQAALRVVDVMPEVPLYVVASKSKAQREHMLKYKLTARVPLSVEAYKKAVGAGMRKHAKASLESMARDTIDASLELGAEGSLPDIHTNRMQNTRLLDRTFAAHAAAIGQAHQKEFKQLCNTELSNTLERH